MQTGLSKMARNNVHMAIGLPDKKGVINGMKNSCDIFIEINLLKAIMLGQLKFYTSINKVVFSPAYTSINKIVISPGIGQ